MALCAGADCGKDAAKLKCPTCLRYKIDSYFCDQACFKRNWTHHKAIHPRSDDDSTFDPFPESTYTGKLRAAYPLSPRRAVRDDIQLPDYAKDGQPRSEQKLGRSTVIRACTPEEVEKMREVCRLGREIIDLAGAAIKPGVTTEELDRIIHEACMERGGYPSPLNYYNFPKSCCTSVNEVICHGIPDKRPLEDGDIVNIDVSFYKGGVHADLNETYYVGDKAKANPDTVRLVEGTREALEACIEHIKPGALFRSFGDIIEKVAKKNNLSVVRSFVGHGVNDLFHGPPNIPHYAKNKAIGTCKPGVTFTIEPMLCLGSYRDKLWPDNWTAVTVDGKWSAQFEHTFLVTEDGVEVLTARKPDSPGGPVPRPA